MYDIELDENGDILLDASGDIKLTESIRQIVQIRLRWFYGEWRLGKELGFPYFEEVLVKNPNINKVKALIRDEILKIDGIAEAEVIDFDYDKKERKATVEFKYVVGEETYREEIELYG